MFDEYVQDILIQLLPFLSTDLRFKLAQAGSRTLRQLILSEQYEQEAFIEYVKCGAFYNVLDTWDKSPFTLRLSRSTSHGTVLFRKHLETMRDKLTTWHTLYMRARQLRVHPSDFPLRDRRLSVTWRKTFQELAAEGAHTIMTEAEAWERVSNSFPDTSCHLLIILLKSGHCPPKYFKKIPPMDLICWCHGIEIPGMKALPSLDSVRQACAFTGAYPSHKTFFSWAYASDTNVESAPRFDLWSAQASWRLPLTLEIIKPQAYDVGFKAFNGCNDPVVNLSLVLYKAEQDEITLYGKTACTISVKRRF